MMSSLTLSKSPDSWGFSCTDMLAGGVRLRCVMCRGIVYAREDEVRFVGTGGFVRSIYLSVYLYEGRGV